MRSLLLLVASSALLALSATPAQAWWGRNSNLPVPGRMDGQAYNPAAWGNAHPMHYVHLHSPYPTTVLHATPLGVPSAPPAPPFCQQLGHDPIFLPAAPDLMNPGPFGVLPPFQPFQGMLLPPRATGGMVGHLPMGGGHGGQGGGHGGMYGQGGPPMFGSHPFARSPRDFFMSGF